MDAECCGPMSRSAGYDAGKSSTLPAMTDPGSSNSPTGTALVVGAGLGGALMACHLARMGYRVIVAERRPDPRAAGFIGGRSINLALSTRGITALERVGLAERVLKDAVPMPGRMMHALDGALTFQPYSKDPNEYINSVSRGGLNLTLLEAAAAHDHVTLRFDLRCLDVDLDAPSATFLNETTNEEETIGADFIIGADGAFSAVRTRLVKNDRYDYSQSYLSAGYKELSIPPTPEGGFALEKNALHIWPRGGSMMIALPNADGSFTCTLFWPFEGDHSFAAIRSREDILPFFTKHYPDAVPLMPTLEDDYERNPTSSLVTIRCAPWHWKDKVVLLGDAAHAIVPFFGQGMNAAFEDCTELTRLLETYRHDRRAAFEVFSRSRKPNADAIADLAIANFVEMRDKVGSPLFLYRKKLEKKLHAWFPDWYLPLYNMVSFSTIPYAQARDRARKQDRTVLAIVIALAAIVVFILLILLAWIF